MTESFLLPLRVKTVETGLVSQGLKEEWQVNFDLK